MRDPYKCENVNIVSLTLQLLGTPKYYLAVDSGRKDLILHVIPASNFKGSLFAKLGIEL